jgi:hypothetical protein
VHGTRRRIEPKLADGEYRHAHLARPPGQRAKPSEQLVEGKGLGQVVVGSTVQPGDAIRNRVERSDHEYRSRYALAPKITAQRKSVGSRKHHVQRDRVVRSCRGHPHGLVGVGCYVGREALCGQSLPQQAGELRLVLDNQDSHGIKDFTIIVGEP